MNGRELYLELNRHLLRDAEPSRYLNRICGDPLFRQVPFDMLDRLRQTAQSPIYHPEGSVWNHTMLVVDEAAGQKEKSARPAVFLWAALLHDIGKPDATTIRKGKITSYNHEIIGERLAVEFLSCFTDDEDFIRAVAALVRRHMQILFVVKSLPFADLEGMKREADFHEVGLLGFCDRLGRLNADSEKEKKNLRLFYKQCGQR
ncbi:hypothetical protein CAFE_05660 [Caprobacter fermentans]|uniref:HD domain-containing protein n=1 Tax=Caproicibacter fermentans TaxID=2576756 RepID=A0A6N8HWM2_9FIRM|nr:HD domain-containing protein [Caproicibacter fermentans]MVB09897.1 hypothetical protein [Caproicibacter fermentans]